MSHPARNDQRAIVRAIWLKRFKGGPMDPVRRASLEPGVGLIGNANRGGRRQVTLISDERWSELTRQLRAALDPATRRANLLLRGIDLEKSRGRILCVGSARLRINGETRPCEQMEAAHPGLQDAMRPHWGGGAFAEVLDGGDIAVGDRVEWDSAE